MGCGYSSSFVVAEQQPPPAKPITLTISANSKHPLETRIVQVSDLLIFAISFLHLWVINRTQRWKVILSLKCLIHFQIQHVITRLSCMDSTT
ncbi:hypothetical protein L9F63_001236 [Diploptera punctata]|uniref:Uncharacterized protein n=1 Tax=Diploptera punctata TaxID=6984 RepID=A0AAD8A409_DIPPU|nr:hypothetical protein L9F63_001236 [Diploptera punctata]